MSEKIERRAEINMERNVGSLQEQALKRKERLKALRDKQLHVSFVCGNIWFMINATLPVEKASLC